MTVAFNRGAPLAEEAIAAAEAQMGFRLPSQFRRFVALHDGARPEPEGFDVPGFGGTGVRRFLPLAKIERTRRITEGFPAQWAFPIAEDDVGNLVFMRAGDDAIYFWDHEVGGPGV